MNFKDAYIWIVLIILSCDNASAQTDEIACLKVVNSTVHQALLKQNDEIGRYSDSIKLIFELFINENGRVDSAIVKKSNLIEFNINELVVVSSIVGESFSCLREVYFKDKVPPDRIIVPYNTKFLGD